VILLARFRRFASSHDLLEIWPAVSNSVGSRKADGASALGACLTAQFRR